MHTWFVICSTCNFTCLMSNQHFKSLPRVVFSIILSHKLPLDNEGHYIRLPVSFSWPWLERFLTLSLPNCVFHRLILATTSLGSRSITIDWIIILSQGNFSLHWNPSHITVYEYLAQHYTKSYPNLNTKYTNMIPRSINRKG